MTVETLLASLHLAVPELILAVGALVLLMIGVFNGEKSATTVTGLAVALLVAAALWLLIVAPEGEAFGGAYLADPFSRFMKVLALVGSTLMVYSDEKRGEAPTAAVLEPTAGTK